MESQVRSHPVYIMPPFLKTFTLHPKSWWFDSAVANAPATTPLCNSEPNNCVKPPATTDLPLASETLAAESATASEVPPTSLSSRTPVVASKQEASK